MTIALSTTLTASALAQTLYNADTRALPGDSVNFVGDNLPANAYVTLTPINADGSLGTSQNVSPSAISPGLIEASVPVTFAPGLWMAQIGSSGSLIPGTLYINRPVPQFADADQIAPGGWFRIYGRNMANPSSSGSPYIRLVDSNGISTVIPATQTEPYDKSPETHMLTAQMPSSIVPGMTYTVFVNNGSGGPTGEAQLAGTVTGMIPNPDPWGLEVPWAGDYLAIKLNYYNVANDSRLPVHLIGDGATSNQANLQTLITWVNRNGGGILFFPAGTYKIGGTAEVEVLSKVVLAGAGAGQTILQVGYNYTALTNPANQGLWPLHMYNAMDSGILNLTIQNLNTNPVANPVLDIENGSSPSDRTFVKGCDIQLGNGLGVYCINGRHVSFCNNTIESTASSSALAMNGTTFARVAFNTISYRYGRITLNACSNITFESNVVSRDNNYAYLGEPDTGGLELTTARELLVRRNTIQGTGPFPSETIDGELINSQRDNCTDFEDFGTAGSGTANTLTDPTASFQTSAPFDAPKLGSWLRSSVQIVAGTGTGQTRFITSNTATQLTVDRPWEVIPDSTSVYAIGPWSAAQILILNNKLSNSIMAVEFWGGAWQCTVESNQSFDTTGILLRGVDEVASDMVTPRLPYGRRHASAWDNWISYNVIKDVNGYLPPKITAYGCNVDGALLGTLGIANQIVGNNVTELKIPVVLNSQLGNTAGFFNFNLLMGNYAGTMNGSASMGWIGTIILRNGGVNANPLFNVYDCWPVNTTQ